MGLFHRVRFFYYCPLFYVIFLRLLALFYAILGILRGKKNALHFYARRLFTTTADGTRTRTVVAHREILSLLRLPFRHYGTAWLRVVLKHKGAGLTSKKEGMAGRMPQKVLSCSSAK